MSKHIYYQQRIIQFESELTTLKQQSKRLAWTRLISFVCFIGLPVLYFTALQHPAILILSFISLATFAVLVNKNLKLDKRITLLNQKIQINKDELCYIDHNYADRENGSAYSQFNPYLANDFDIFGQGSLYQYLNRCTTLSGKLHLAKSLCNPPQDKKIIEEKQAAIRELSQHIDFIQEFQSHGRLTPENGHEIKTLQAWIAAPDEQMDRLRVGAFVLTGINICWILCAAIGIFTWGSLGFPMLASLALTGLKAKNVLKAHSDLENISKVFVKYKTLFRLIENQKFDSRLLCSLQHQLFHKTEPASKSLSSLFRILSVFDIRDNVILGFILNAVFLIDIQTFYYLQQWKTSHKAHVQQWFSSLAEMETLISFSLFAFNNSDSVTYPQIETGHFFIRTENIGHPLIPYATRVNNSFSMSGTPSITIITGANMAGKSTFLRTVSINLLLGMNGAPVCATTCTFAPCTILSSIKIQDSLSENASYFYAELLRLKNIIEYVEGHPYTLVILDEILRGTNTKDKQIGSLGLLEKFMGLQASVIIATHDLVIGELEVKYPEAVTNHCFEVELTDDQLHFDYKLKNGISKKLNASFLMKKMNIID